MAKLTTFALAIAAVVGAPTGAFAKPVTEKVSVAKAARIVATEPAKAMALVEPLIAESGAMSPATGTRYFCTSDPVDTLVALGGATADKANGVTYDADVCTALYVTGYALIDLHRAAEAEPFLRRAVELDANNAHYLNEYAEWHKSARHWQQSYDLFAKAADMAAQQPGQFRDTRHARSLRGMGYNLIELGRLDDAERLMNAALKLEPESQAAKNELAYIAEQRAKAAKH